MTEPSPPTSGAAADLPDRLAEHWSRGGRPDLGAFLTGAGPLCPADLLALVLVDQQQRWLAGERPIAEDYLVAYPALNHDAECVVELIYSEFLLRERVGDPPAADEFPARFPAHAVRLRRQIELHRALASSGSETLSSRAEPSLPATRKVPAPGPLIPDWPTIPGYELVRKLGQGGMGIVFEARDLRRGRSVALKLMQEADPAALYRFKREFRALAELNHPHLVVLYELVADAGLWFFTMELLDGVNFLAHVRGVGPSRRPLAPDPVDRLRGALAQLTEGVLALHAAGRLHRDIKPGNVLVTREGRVVLLDFGLAAELDRSGRYLSIRPGLVGTLDYMAPEQAAALPVSPASDWYSVGVMLYEALTGRPPFEGTPQELLLAKQRDDPPPPADLAPGVPDDLAALCLELLRRPPSARPAGEEVLRRLRSAPALHRSGPPRVEARCRWSAGNGTWRPSPRRSRRRAAGRRS